MTNAESGVATSAPPIQVKHIDHVTIVVEDLDRSRDFYVRVLGMQEVERPGFSFPGLWFQAGPTQVHLILEHPESGPSGHSIATEASISRTRHFAFEVVDARQAKQSLDALGVPIVAGPKSRPDGPTQLYVRDPDGHLVELFSFA